MISVISLQPKYRDVTAVGGQEMGLKSITSQQLLFKECFEAGGLGKVWMWIGTALWKFSALYVDISVE
jgi:hypothetical protein